MGKVVSLRRSWTRITALPEAFMLIERGIVLQRKDVRRVVARFDPAEQDAIIAHFAFTFCNNVSSWSMAERTVESLLVWLTWAGDDRAARVFIAELCGQKNFRRACWVLIEIALSDKISQLEHGERIFATSVSFICELGRSLLGEEGGGKISSQDLLWNHLATWLLSLSSINSSAIRLSLLSYLGSMSHTEMGKKFFNRIMRRFGYTVLDHLFFMLFNRKSEAMALEYMLHNLPWVLGGDYFTQKIMRSIFQHYMYRYPERSLLFLRTFTDELLARPPDPDIQKHKLQNEIEQSLLSHLAALYLVVSEINQRALVPEFIEVLGKFRSHAAFLPTLNTLQASEDLKPYFRSWLTLTVRDDIKIFAPKPPRKRGRRPSFSRTKASLSTLEMVAFLGNNEATGERKAS